MSDGRTLLLCELLHEVAEGLQSTGHYLGAIRRVSTSEGTSTADMMDKAAAELARAQAAFHRLHTHLSEHGF